MGECALFHSPPVAKSKQKKKRWLTMIDSLRVLRSLKKKRRRDKNAHVWKERERKKTFFPSPFARSSMFVPKKKEKDAHCGRMLVEEVRMAAAPLSNFKYTEKTEKKTRATWMIDVPVEKEEKFR